MNEHFYSTLKNVVLSFRYSPIRYKFIGSLSLNILLLKKNLFYLLLFLVKTFATFLKVKNRIKCLCNAKGWLWSNHNWFWVAVDGSG